MSFSISKILFFLVLFQFNFALDFSNTAICEGNMLCTKDCTNCNLCNATTCSIDSNCFCPTKIIPGNIPLADAPQFFSFTIDDSMHEGTPFSIISKLNYWLNDATLIDRNNCKMKPTIFAMNPWSDFGIFSYLDKIGEVSVHATTHTTSYASTYRKWKNELSTCYNDIAELSQITPKGSRAPYLEYNDDYFKVLKELGLSYDSSSVYFARSYNPNNPAAQTNWYPFTLDFGYPEASIGYTAGVLTKRVPGIWEFPMIGFQYTDGTEYEIMDYTISSTFLEDFKRDFDKNYNSNRAPFGLYFHAAYFMKDDLTGDDPAKLKIYADLLRWVMTNHTNVLYATPQRIIKWMKNPKNFAQTKLMQEFQCPSATITTENPCNSGVAKTECKITNIPWNTCQDQCPGGTYTFNICGDQCPNKLSDIDVTWAYQGGKARTYIQDPTYFDPTTPASNAKYYHFPGTVTIEDPINGTYNLNTGLFGINGKFCSNIIVSNPSQIEGANGFILTIDGCTLNSKLTSTYGYPIETYVNGKFSGFRMIGKNVEFMRVTDTTVGTICMDVNKNVKNTFKLSSLKAGVDLYNQTLTCDLGSTTNPCTIFCGNKVKNSGETTTNCPVDTSSRTCPTA